MEQGSAYRLAFFEMLLYWQGVCRSQHIIEQFGVSRQVVNQDINLYRERYPNNIKNERSPFEASDEFKACFYDLSQNVYLDWLATKRFVLNEIAHTPEWFYSPYLLMPKLTPKVMRPVVDALMGKKRLDIEYEALKTPDAEGRIIQPHALVKTARRYHLRAYCERSKEFKDFVLTRIRGVPEVIGEATKSVQDDTDWQTQVCIIISPDSRLSTIQKKVLADDYQMADGRLELYVPGAMVQYTLEDLGINWRSYAPSPLAQQFEIVNLTDIEPWLIK